MATLAAIADIRISSVSINDDHLSLELMDGRAISVPILWYPRLANATPQQRNAYELSGGGYGIHWPELDENLSVEGLLRGARGV